VSGLHELVGNALIMKGEKKRTTDLREDDLANIEEAEEASAAESGENAE